MNKIAEQLNTCLDKTIVGKMLSTYGRNIFFPKGIVAQSAEAGKIASINATVGMACKNKQVLTLPSLLEMTPELNSNEAVAYAPTGGISLLRTKWQELQRIKNPHLVETKSTLPMVVAGLTNGIFHIAELFVEEGDIVIMPNMFWGNYRLIFSERRGAHIHTFPLFNSSGGFNIKGLQELLSTQLVPNKKVIILLNFPNNPTGYSPNTTEVEQIGKVIKNYAEEGNKVLTIHDDAYFGFFYEQDIYKESLFVNFANLHPNILAIKIDGPTKEVYAWGFRIGFITFASCDMTEEDFSPLLNKLMGSIRANVSNCSSISQNILLKVLNHPNYLNQKLFAEKELACRYYAVKSFLKSSYEGERGRKLLGILSPLPFNSGYFMTFKVQYISAEDLRVSLLKKGFGTIALGDDFLRLAFSSVDIKDIPLLYNAVFNTALELHAK